MAGSAGIRWLHIPGFLKLFSKGLAVHTFGRPAQVGDLIERTQMLPRVTMTIEAPSHGHRLLVTDYRHLVDAAMAFDAGDPAVYMRGMAEVGVIGNFMHLDPFD